MTAAPGPREVHHTRIGRHVRLVNERQLQDYEDDYITVRDGIIVVPRQGFVPDGYTF